MAGWLRGTVVNVRSGDTLTIAGAVKSGIPPQKRITLSSLKAPTLGRGDGSSADEPFAWASREALRKLTIGQSVIFKVDYVVDSISREFGTVFLENGNKDNVALVHVSRGWAKVRYLDRLPVVTISDLTRVRCDVYYFHRLKEASSRALTSMP